VIVVVGIFSISIIIIIIIIIVIVIIISISISISISILIVIIIIIIVTMMTTEVLTPDSPALIRLRLRRHPRHGHRPVSHPVVCIQHQVIRSIIVCSTKSFQEFCMHHQVMCLIRRILATRLAN
jgi:hypothetical protein